MSFVIADRVRETTTTTGTGAVTLAGAYTSFQSFASAIGNGNNTYYTIASPTTGDWEVGIGTYTSGTNTLSRDTVLASSNSGSLVNLGAGSKDVFVTQPAERSLLVQNGGSGLFAGVAAFSSGGLLYASSTSALTTGSALTFDGTNLSVGGNADPFGRFYTRSIGLTSSGSSVLEINGTSYGGIDLGVSGTRYFGMTANSTDVILGSLNGAVPLEFQINGSEQMRLTSTGLGIGTSSPSYKLDVQQNNSGSSVYASVSNTYSGGGSARLRLWNTGDFSDGFALINNSGASGQVNILNYKNSAMGFWTNATQQMLLDTSGNLGLGVTPSAWSGWGVPVLQLSNAGTVVSNDQNLYVGANWYYNSAYKYTQSGAATYYKQGAGSHQWFTAPSGTAGDAISFTQAMTLDASGNLQIGTTTQSGIITANSNVASQAGSIYTRNTNGGASAYSGLTIGNDVSNNKGGILLASSAASASGFIGPNSTYFYNADGLIAINAQSNYPILFGVNNSEQMRLTSTGLGIGTSSPSSKFVVSNGGAAGLEVNPTGSASSPVIYSYNRSTNAYGILTSISSEARWQTGSSPSETMRLDSSGNLGLGVTPSAWGAGGGNIETTGSGGSFVSRSGANIVNNAYYNSGWKYINGSSAYANYFAVNSNGTFAWNVAGQGTAGNAISFTQAMTLTNGGQLLLGATTNPSSAQFLVSVAENSTGNTIASFGNVSSYRAGIVYTGTSTGYYGTGLVLGCDVGSTQGANRISSKYGSTPPNLVFEYSTNSQTYGDDPATLTFAEGMRMDGSGNLLVGTTSSGSYLVRLTLSYDSGTTKWSVGPWSGAGGSFVVAANASQGVYLPSTTSTSWSSASDERLKENLTPIENGLEKVCSLRSVTGNFISDESKQRKSFLIAQDVQTVLPEAISSTPDGKYLGVSYTDTIPLLVAAIKELKAEFDAYKASHP
jgi:Chaperone of endosialidase